MNPYELAEPLGQLAAAIAEKEKLECAAILTVDDNKVALFFGGREEINKDRMVKICESCGEKLSKLARDIAAGKVEPTDLDQSQPEQEPPSQWRVN